MHSPENPRQTVATCILPNLAAAFAGETHEYTDMYPGMAKEAREEDFEEIPDFVRRGR